MDEGSWRLVSVETSLQKYSQRKPCSYEQGFLFVDYLFVNLLLHVLISHRIFLIYYLYLLQMVHVLSCFLHYTNFIFFCLQLFRLLPNLNKLFNIISYLLCYQLFIFLGEIQNFHCFSCCSTL